MRRRKRHQHPVTDLSLLATTNPFGAGKWNSELNKWFEGRKTVYILEDNDAPGRKHAVKVARNLVDIVDEVRIVRFPDVPEGEDVTYWLNELKHTKAELLERAEAAPAFSDLPIITLIESDLSRVVDETMEAMKAARVPVLIRAGRLVEPLWSEERPAAGGHKTTTTILRHLGIPNLRYIMMKHVARIQKYDGRKKTEIMVKPSNELLEMILQHGHGPFPRVAGVINAPTMRPDGTIFSAPGYDEATRLWYHPAGNLTLPDIPDKPTKDEARAALKVLNDLLIEVAFSKENNLQALNRSVALAAILTAVLRGAFDLAPLFLFLAYAAGTGKSFLVDIIATIVSGRWCPVITYASTREEMEKRLGALLLEGAPLISIDNLSGDLKGDLLAQMVERPLIKPRILGKSETPECEWRGVLFATGNNVRLVGDMTRRGLICNLDAVEETPEEREFKFNPIAMVSADRGKYVGAALTIARAYRAAGKRVKCKQLGSYGDWSRVVREPLLWLEEEDPVKSMDQARKHDPERLSAQELIRMWKYLDLKRTHKVVDIIESEGDQRARLGLGSTDWERVSRFYDLLFERASKRVVMRLIRAASAVG